MKLPVYNIKRKIYFNLLITDMLLTLSAALNKASLRNADQRKSYFCIVVKAITPK